MKRNNASAGKVNCTILVESRPLWKCHDVLRRLPYQPIFSVGFEKRSTQMRFSASEKREVFVFFRFPHTSSSYDQTLKPNRNANRSTKLRLAKY